MKIQNTVIVSVYGGVVQDIATDLDPERVRFILIDRDLVELGDDPNGRDVTPSKITDVFGAQRQRELGILAATPHDDLPAAAREVVKCWEHGDLAGAVQWLARALGER